MAKDIYVSGQIVAGRYRIVRTLGRGGFGGLFLAEQMSMQRPVAFKVLLPKHGDDENQRSRFELEARTACRLAHPNTVIYHDFGHDAQGRPFLVMEYLDGRTLAELHKQNPILPLSRAIHIVAQVCAALAEAHQEGIIHRDLKCANVMLVQRGNNPDFVKVIDFGILKRIGPARGRELTETDVILGTPQYMAPEMLLGEPYDGRADQYSLAIILYELLAGQRPFDSIAVADVIEQQIRQNPVSLLQLEVGRRLPRLVDEAVCRALSKNPAERFPSMQDFRRFLLAAAGQPEPAPLRQEEQTKHAATARDQYEAAIASTVMEFKNRDTGLKNLTVPQPAVPKDTPAENPLVASLRKRRFGRWAVAAMAAASLTIATLVTLFAVDPTPALHRSAELQPDPAIGRTGEAAAPPAAEAIPVCGSMSKDTCPAAGPLVSAAAPLPRPVDAVAMEIDAERTAIDVRSAPDQADDARPAPFPEDLPLPVPQRSAEEPAAVVKHVPESPAAKGYLTVNAEPFAEIFVDGTRIGTTPIQRWALLPGKHRILAVHPILGRQSHGIHVLPGKGIRYTFQFKRDSTGMSRFGAP